MTSSMLIILLVRKMNQNKQSGTVGLNSNQETQKSNKHSTRFLSRLMQLTYPLKYKQIFERVILLGVILLMGAHLYHFDINKVRGGGATSTVPIQAGQGEGLLMYYARSSDECFLQLKIRRGVLLDLCQINMIPYIAQSAPAIEKILNRVYGSSFLDSPDMHSKGLLYGLYSSTRMTWEKRMLVEWEDIRREFSVSDVLAPSEWKLSLPKVTTTDKWTLYHIPGEISANDL
jgi:hypothetical protein